MIKSRLKILLAEHDMSQKMLAEKTGVLPNTISKICNNEIVRVPIDAIDKICEALDCEVGELFTRIKDDKQI